MKTAIFLVALVAISVRASPLEGRPLKDDADDYSIGFAADYDMSGDEEEWEEFLERGEPSEFYLQEVREQLAMRTAPQTQPLARSKRHNTPGMKQQYYYFYSRLKSLALDGLEGYSASVP